MENGTSEVIDLVQPIRKRNNKKAKIYFFLPFSFNQFLSSVNQFNFPIFLRTFFYNQEME